MSFNLLKIYTFPYLSIQVSALPASISATGLVEAIGTGSTDIAVSYGDLRKIISVTVAVRIPLTDISVNEAPLTLSVGNQVQVSARPVPANATEVLLVWISENPTIATVNATGKIEALAQGVTKIIVSQGSIRKEISVSVIAAFDKREWIATADSYLSGWNDGNGSTGGGGHPQRTIDSDITSAWHSSTSGSFDASTNKNLNALPHWVRIDMLSQKDVSLVELYLHPRYQYARTVQILLSDSPEEATWELATGFTFPAGGVVSNVVELPPNKTGRYLIVRFMDSSSNPYSNLAEVYVY